MNHPQFKTCFCVGREVLVAELEGVGLQVQGGLEYDGKYDLSYEELRKEKIEHKVDVVVTSYDYKFNIFKIASASYAV